MSVDAEVLTNGGNQEIRGLMVVPMNVGLLVAGISQKFVREVVVDTVGVFVLIHLDLIQDEVGGAILTHPGAHDCDVPLGRCIGHGSFLLTGDLPFEPTDAKLDLFDGVKRPAEFRHPAGQGNLLSFEVDPKALELTLLIGVVDRWSRRGADNSASKCGHVRQFPPRC
jgi:hypothetical protein